MKKEKVSREEMGFKIDFRSLGIGVVVGCLLMWVLFIREPFLSSPEDKGSYAFGQQIGRNLKQGFVQVNPRIFRVGMEHALRDFSKLEDKEKQEGIRHLQEKSMPKRMEAQKNQPAPAAAPQALDSEGLTKTPFGFSFRKSTWTDYAELRIKKPAGLHESEQIRMPRWNTPANYQNTRWKFELKIRDATGTILFARKNAQALSFVGKELPASLSMPLSEMKKNETWILKIQGWKEADPRQTFQWPIPINESHWIEIKKLN